MNQKRNKKSSPKALEQLLAREAPKFAQALLSAAEEAQSEEDIRVAAERALGALESASGMRLGGKHEFTVASGRIDSVYERVLIEYKNPKSPSNRIGPTLKSKGTKDLIDQIKSRFPDIEREIGHKPERLLGVGTDGARILFVRYYGGSWDVSEPETVDERSAKKLLWGILGLGLTGRAFHPESLAKDFASTSAVAKSVVPVLYRAIRNAKSAKAETLFNQWSLLYKEVCGDSAFSPREHLKELAQTLGIEEKPVQPDALLFALHSYLALFMKLVAAEVLSVYHSLPSAVRRVARAKSTKHFSKEFSELEAGGIFRHLGITNFLEGDLFSWYIDEWSTDIEEALRGLIDTLARYNPSTLSEDPDNTRDLVKHLYQRLFPKGLRHDLGEYYTPDWLADFVLDNAKYDGDPRVRLLDPACGSGTFLLHAIAKIRSWYDAHGMDERIDEESLVHLILQNVVGFDLNPIAVMSARTNFLIALRDLLPLVDNIELPIYACDTIATPQHSSDLFTGSLGSAMVLNTVVGPLSIPTEVTRKPSDLMQYIHELEFHIEHGRKFDEFAAACGQNQLPFERDDLHQALYQKLEKLHKANRNSIWARIISNAFAPLFVEKFDYVVGNPPWINWRYLPDDYRESIADLWTHYNLFPHRGLKARLGGAMDDLSTLMTYVCADRYLKLKGRLAFVITQTAFQSAGGGKGFRRFTLPKDEYLRVQNVNDFTSFQPFEGATNRTAVVYFKKSSTPTKYPVRYIKQRPKRGAKPQEWRSASEASGYLKSKRYEARPASAEATSAWIILPPGVYERVEPVLGASDYRARVGAHSGGAAGVFWIDIERQVNRKTTLISNRHDAGKNKYQRITCSVETALIRPLVRGRDVTRWYFEPSAKILIAYENQNDGKAISESELAANYRKTFEYFKQFENKLKKRAHYNHFFKKSGAPFWSMYNVGNYTFAKYKVVWREQSKDFQCAVVGPIQGRPVVPDAKLTVVPCGSKAEAYYLCAVLNSSPVRSIVEAYVIGIQTSTHILEHVFIPRFQRSNAGHKKLSSLGEQCHKLASADQSVYAKEQEIDQAAAALWGLEPGDAEFLREKLKS